MDDFSLSIALITRRKGGRVEGREENSKLIALHSPQMATALKN